MRGDSNVGPRVQGKPSRLIASNDLFANGYLCNRHNMEIYVWYFSAYTFGSFVHNMPIPDWRSFVSIKCRVVNMGSMIIHIMSE